MSHVLDETIRFSCGSCTACCDQPWRTLIEPDKAAALDRHDFSEYPHLAGKAFYSTGRDPSGLYELAKGEGTRCLFLDHDGLCIIHKELGAEAKPQMCRQFPFLPTPSAGYRRLSANFGCPSVQTSQGRPLSEQEAEATRWLHGSGDQVDAEEEVPLDGQDRLSRAQADALFERMIARFDPASECDIWSRFAETLTLLVEAKPPREPEAQSPPVPRVYAYRQPEAAPMPARFLFAANMYPDAVPVDSVSDARLLKRLTMVPKLMALAKLAGGYSSRLLSRNVSISKVLAHPVEPEIPRPGQVLLARYYRSRLWQRFPAGTRLSMIGGVHQHILDLNAIVFFARAIASHENSSKLGEDLLRKALRHVEFHIANQTRLYDHVLKGWLGCQLDSLGMAFASLRLMALRPEPASQPQEPPTTPGQTADM